MVQPLMVCLVFFLLMVENNPMWQRLKLVKAAANERVGMDVIPEGFKPLPGHVYYRGTGQNRDNKQNAVYIWQDEGLVKTFVVVNDKIHRVTVSRMVNGNPVVCNYTIRDEGEQDGLHHTLLGLIGDLFATADLYPRNCSKDGPDLVIPRESQYFDLILWEFKRYVCVSCYAELPELSWAAFFMAIFTDRVLYLSFDIEFILDVVLNYFKAGEVSRIR